MRKRLNRIMPRLLGAWVLGLVLILGLGCGGKSDLPTIKGKVTYKDKSPVPGGVIEFRSAKEAGVTFFGQIESGGTFEATAVAEKENVDAALTGTFHVVVIPEIGGNQGEVVIEHPKKMKLDPAGSNDVHLIVPKLR